MKRTLAAIAFLTILMVSFQNCASRSFSTSSSPDLSSAPSSKATVAASDFDKVALWNNEKQQILEVNLQSGEMTAFEDYGNVRGDRYCLSAADLSEVKTILANSSVCVPDIDYKEVQDRACAMLYQYPYASLSNQKDEVKLGEKTSGCDKPSDLCGDKGPMLKNFATATIKKLDQLHCQ